MWSNFRLRRMIRAAALRLDIGHTHTVKDTVTVVYATSNERMYMAAVNDLRTVFICRS